MKKIAFVLSIMLMLCSIASAQDVITLRKGKEIKGYVKDVTSTEVKYTNADNPEGAVLTIPKKEVTIIHYQNGAVEEFQSEKEEQAEEESEKPAQPAIAEDSLVWTKQRVLGAKVFADVAGFAFYGPLIGVELRWRSFAIEGHYKLAGMGMLNNDYLGNLNEYYTTECDPVSNLEGSALGVMAKVYMPLDSKGSSIHAGFRYETGDYTYTRHSDAMAFDESWTTQTKTTAFGIGYSYHAPVGFYWGMGGSCGITVFSGDVERKWADGTETRNEVWSHFFGIIEATIGWEFSIKK